MQIKTALEFAAKKFLENIPNPYTEARILLKHVLKSTTEYIIINPHIFLSPKQIKQYNKCIERRLVYEPLSYILGYKEFYGRDFIVNNSVLIPRPDTETLVDSILENYKKATSLQILELGVGSGAISITLLMELPKIFITAVDISAKALKLTIENLLIYKCRNRIKLLKSDWFSNINNNFKYDVIICNPPYIALSDLALMSQETLLHEPHLALFAQNSGLESYIKIAKNIINFLQPQGKIFLEIGFNQLKSVIAIFEERGLKLFKVYYDLQKHPRVVVFQN